VRRRHAGRHIAALLVAPLCVLLLAGPAAADDEFEIDERLVDAGYRDAYTTYINAEDGVRVVVEYRSDSNDRAGSEAETEDIARLVWENLELRVVAVDIASTQAAQWLDGDVPPMASLVRGDLQQRFGPRDAALDTDESPSFGEDEALIFLGVGALVVLFVGAGGGFLVGWLIGQRRGRRSVSGAAPPWQQAQWQQPQQWPAQQFGTWGDPPPR
jgi:hypothetical protein